MATDSRSYRFDDFTLRPADRQLLKRGKEVVLRPKAFDTLACLVQRHGHAVPREQLLDIVWPDTSVSEAVLTHCITEVRQALTDDVRSPRFVKTMSRHGYKFIAPVAVLEPPADAPATGAVAVITERPVPPPSAIVVLPFANMSGDPENEYLCDGLSEELINGLTKVGGLQVVAHSSSFSFKGRDLDAREIGRQLHVGTILEGSVRKTGNRLRVSAQLIDAARGYHLWCDQYDRRLEDVFAIQDEISQAILASLKVEFLKDERTPLIAPSTTNMDAYVLYLKGRTFWHKRYGGFLQRAMDCFGQSIAKDPGFALPYAGLADSLASLGIWGFAPPRDTFPKAATLADTAMTLQPSLGEAHASRALVRLFWDWEWDAAGRGFARSIELNPGFAQARMGNGHYLSIVGRMDEAIAEMKRSQALDPISPVCSANVGWTFHLAHRQEEAASELHQVLVREPGNGLALFYLGFVLVEMARYEEAIDALRKAGQVMGGMPWLPGSIGMVQGLMGNRPAARATLSEVQATPDPRTYVPWSAHALIQLGLGEDEAVLDSLDRAVDHHDALLPWLAFMPAFDRLHVHPRFQGILARLGL